MTHEPAFGCRWAVIREKQEEDPPIMAEDDEGSFVMYEHFAQLQEKVKELEREANSCADLYDRESKIRAQLQATLAAREAEVGQLNTVLREAGWGQGEIDSAAYTFDKLVQANRKLVAERDAAVRDAQRYRYLRARAALDKSDKQRITWHIPMWDIPRCYQDIPIKDQLDKDLDEAIKRA